MTLGSRKATCARYRGGIGWRLLLLTAAASTALSLPPPFAAGEASGWQDLYSQRYLVVRSPSGQALAQLGRVDFHGAEESRIDLLVKTPARNRLLLTETSSCTLGQGVLTTRFLDHESGWWLELHEIADLGCKSLLEITVDTVMRAKSEGRAMETTIRTSQGGLAATKDGDTPADEGSHYLARPLREVLAEEAVPATLLEAIEFFSDGLCLGARREIGEGPCRAADALARAARRKDVTPPLAGYREVDWQVSLAPMESETRPSSALAVLIGEFPGLRWDGKRLTEDR